MGAGQHCGIQGQDPSDVDFVSPTSRPDISPDIVNRTFDGNDVEAVLGKGDVKAGVHRAELVDLPEMPAAAIEGEASFFVN